MTVMTLAHSAEELLLSLKQCNVLQGHSSHTGNTGINLPRIVDDIMWGLQCQQKAEQCMAALRDLSGQQLASTPPV